LAEGRRVIAIEGKDMKYTVTTKINAKPAVIWATLVDGAKYPEWNTTVERVDGNIALGNKITVHPKMTPKRAFAVKVTELTPARKMTWTGGMPLGLFKGVRTFTLSEIESGITEFSMTEVFSGPLLPLIRKSMPDLQPAFDEFAARLKQRFEH